MINFRIVVPDASGTRPPCVRDAVLRRTRTGRFEIRIPPQGIEKRKIFNGGLLV